MKLKDTACTILALIILLTANSLFYVTGKANDKIKVDIAKSNVGPEIEGYTLSVHTEKNVYAPLEKVNLRITIKNVANDDVKILKESALSAYKLEVILPDGKKAPMTLYGEGALKPDNVVTPSAAGILKPNEEFTSSLLVNILYDMTLEGDYKISVTTMVSKRENAKEFIAIQSNVAQVNVNENLLYKEKKR